MKTGAKAITKTYYQVMLIPEQGVAVTLPYVYADADFALSVGRDRAAEMFPGQCVEVIAIHTASRDAVRATIVTGGTK